MTDILNSDQKYIAIDDEGFFKFKDIRVTDEEYGLKLLSTLSRTRPTPHRGAFQVTDQGFTIIVEASDEPLVAQQIFYSAERGLYANFNYGFESTISKLCSDEWDRFHGIASNEIPFVMSRKAQAQLFELASDFDDDSLTIENNLISIPPFFIENQAVDTSLFWDEQYQAQRTGWDLAGPSPLLIHTLPQLKLPRSRVLVPGCGRGHDAAHFAKLGHIVTAVDFSKNAIQEAEKIYGHLDNLNFVHADIFEFSLKNRNSFDFIFEHTCFAAISPVQRKSLVKAYGQLLAESGFLLGLFFAVTSRKGPPFGSSEWEIRQRLEKNFQFLYWQRAHHSVPERLGQELLVYARKKS